MLRFQKTYFFIALLLFLLLLFIAMYVRDGFIRPYGGDLLVVIFLYCLVRSFFSITFRNAIFGVLTFDFRGYGKSSGKPRRAFTGACLVS